MFVQLMWSLHVQCVSCLSYSWFILYVYYVIVMQIIQDLVLIMVTFAATLVNALDQFMPVTGIITVGMGRMKLTVVSNCICHISIFCMLHNLCI